MSSSRSTSRHPAPIRRRLSAEQKREAILQAAERRFLHSGYQSTSIDDVIDEIGGSKRTIYKYFGNKEALFAAVIDYMLEKHHIARIDPAGQSVRATLESLASNHMTTVLSDWDMNLWCLCIGEGRLFPDLARTYFDHGPGHAHKVLAEYLEQCAGRGELQIDDPVLAAQDFFGLLLHHATLARVFQKAKRPDAEAVTAQAKRVADMFLRIYQPEG